MGDRGVIKFSSYGNDRAAIYVHNYGSSADEVLDEFFEAELSNPMHDNRFNDASYLAARFVAWFSDPDGLGIGITSLNHTESTNWRVHCESSGRPRIERC